MFFVVKSAKISTILCLFVQKINNVDRIAMVTVTRQSVLHVLGCVRRAFLSSVYFTNFK